MSGSWISMLRPASFAGIGFYVSAQKAKAGRRLAKNEIPLANIDLSDQGPLPQEFTVDAYFLGPSWMTDRLTLLNALNNNAGPQTLVLPTVGPLTVRVGDVSYSDVETKGNYGAVTFECTVDNNAAAPFASPDFASSLLNNIEDMFSSIQTAYQNVMRPIIQNAAVAEYVMSTLNSAASAVLALPSSLLSGVSAPFSSTPANPFSTAAAVTTAFSAISNNALAVINQAATSNNTTIAANSAVAGYVPPAPLPADPSLGLAALASWGGSLPPAAASPAALATARAATIGLVQQSAATALLGLYAQTDFSNAQAAQTARQQLGAAAANTGAAIVDSGQVDLYRAWNALTALGVRDMIQRAQGLPQLADYAFNFSLPDVVIAQRLMQDGGQGDALAALNGAIHPLFMPPGGVWLEAA